MAADERDCLHISKRNYKLCERVSNSRMFPVALNPACFGSLDSRVAQKVPSWKPRKHSSTQSIF